MRYTITLYETEIVVRLLKNELSFISSDENNIWDKQKLNDIKELKILIDKFEIYFNDPNFIKE